MAAVPSGTEFMKKPFPIASSSSVMTFTAESRSFACTADSRLCMVLGVEIQLSWSRFLEI